MLLNWVYVNNAFGPCKLNGRIHPYRKGYCSFLEFIVQVLQLDLCFCLVLQDKAALSQDSVSSANIPNSPAIEEATEKLRSPRRKLPAPKSKSAVTDSVGSPVVEKENDSPDQNKTETGSPNGK